MCLFKDLDLILKKIKDGNTKIIKNKWATDFLSQPFLLYLTITNLKQ